MDCVDGPKAKAIWSGRWNLIVCVAGRLLFGYMDDDDDDGVREEKDLMAVEWERESGGRID